MPNQGLSLKSFCVSEHKDTKTTQPHQLPVYATSSFAFDDVHESIEIFTGNKRATFIQDMEIRPWIR